MMCVYMKKSASTLVMFKTIFSQEGPFTKSQCFVELNDYLVVYTNRVDGKWMATIFTI
jgi:hypothetical protein